ncbi:hypothetical protein [uncultured Roseivirga sp.]|uniref:hypothetical protein n=1 Tax=uncultured Roseivirga sp. TaxID=543088 RepID=UPI000D7A084E|nr:hypothetical protein [uncultured Roseivirga sp.]PWL27923.1 MAG: hypothetical protein DCO95_15745 [Roseivirga sp. XM-24bin3]
MSDKENSTNSEKSDAINLEPIIELVKSSLKDLNVSEIMDGLNKVRIEKINAQKTINNRELMFWKWRFSKEVIITLLILLSIIFLSINDVIEGSTVGTLMGSVIGYSIGYGFSKTSQNG